MICLTCKSNRHQQGGGICADGFVTGGYPDGVPMCMKDDFPDGSPHFNEDGSPRYYRQTAIRKGETP